MRRISVNDDIYFSEIPEEQGPEASSSSKKRRRGSVDRDEKYIEALKDLVLIAQELRKVGGLTALELHRAHAELKSSVLLWMLFKDVPDENKAEFVRELIMT
ncbi:uncharacterized protein G2W53_018282 [Senna tora]|uniref:Uncharacterized protein n=1 Tax=Senna tora TaxID=362788 RepID=A0A834WN64_9FABA|nr:uncharacterized protein G2W53_018282 [Senna tora]